ncbi:ADP-ribosylglycohydrolase family protein [Marinobacterium sp. D7]|uniref:ADP-ribosylglycohydrolase family protein n=1 Tax=Marinobacterium ramblicola TaxID=2849041 RepID=UPI001C2D7438|nr:ADP-ribosylglycohydrolase family protein [Marinobacterium ramblicola]MBV1788211.1 ADP-ribosylglycohydrolase family protein [Marinobacterium ramblicola]
MDPDQDRLRGMLVGLAVGDALGAPVEFMNPGSFEPVVDMRAGGPHRLPEGYWTDDTSMALCSGVSLYLQGGFDPQDHMQRFLRWFREGYLSSTGRCFDIGTRTRQALLRFEKQGELFAGKESFDSAGNGALMRLAPLMIHCHRDPEQAERLAVEHCRLTHGDPRCLEANRLLARVIRLLGEGGSKEEGFLALARGSGDLQHRELRELAGGTFQRREPPQIRGRGYVVSALEAALWAFGKSRTFYEGMLLAVNLGEDSDTTGAIYGQIAGTFYGYHAIPSQWRAVLFQHEAIVALADLLMGREAAPLPQDWF